MDSPSASTGKKPIIVGLYGLPGTGKTTLLSQLKQQPEATSFSFYNGSDVIGTVVPGGLGAFKRLPEAEQMMYRRETIAKIREECAESGRVGVVAGHCMFWPESEEAGSWIVTDADLATYTHIVYLDLPVNIVAERRRDDTKRVREPVAEIHLAKWQSEETSFPGTNLSAASVTPASSSPVISSADKAITAIYSLHVIGFIFL